MMLIVQKLTGLENEKQITELKGMREQRKRGGLKDISSSISLLYAHFEFSQQRKIMRKEVKLKKGF